MTADKSSAEYAYSYQNTPLDGESDSLVIKLRCPRISSIKWCLKLYSLVLGGLGLLLSFVWVCFHLYVLSQTTTQELRLLRYLDIFLGLLLFLSMLSLLYGGYSHSRVSITVFITSSLAVMISYWCWYGYSSYHSEDLAVYDDQASSIGLLLTVLYLLLLLPVLLLYRSLELDQTQTLDQQPTKIERHNWGHTRRPPPKYHESFQFPQA